MNWSSLWTVIALGTLLIGSALAVMWVSGGGLDAGAGTAADPAASPYGQLSPAAKLSPAAQPHPDASCEYAPWSAWTPCSVECGGGGTRARSRELATAGANPDCPLQTQTQVCGDAKCPAAPFALGTKGSDRPEACPTGYRQATSLKECDAAKQSLGSKGSTWLSQGSRDLISCGVKCGSSWMPKKCWLKKGETHGEFWAFNSDTGKTLESPDRRDARQVCVRA